MMIVTVSATIRLRAWPILIPVRSGTVHLLIIPALGTRSEVLQYWYQFQNSCTSSASLYRFVLPLSPEPEPGLTPVT
ncbi:uncharacterized protein F5891DRAFT_487830 [Suillus fuscotomentosus]|uniref:Uncharacterized protein n=1 Tax=Suillus fuscotomentosus TaxID=1912939 RepID=A0AAD4HIS0_9AGAM|nr:uncharacterized protein F5891DRAFT_487830 [Suillus fuscotomentosus]KAG1898123.1 hypothetical protein F5891DRAFT_487830 [Suillus fuscotomentosus]